MDQQPYGSYQKPTARRRFTGATAPEVPATDNLQYPQPSPETETAAKRRRRSPSGEAASLTQDQASQNNSTVSRQDVPWFLTDTPLQLDPPMRTEEQPLFSPNTTKPSASFAPPSENHQPGAAASSTPYAFASSSVSQDQRRQSMRRQTTEKQTAPVSVSSAATGASKPENNASSKPLLTRKMAQENPNASPCLAAAEKPSTVNSISPSAKPQHTSESKSARFPYPSQYTSQKRSRASASAPPVQPPQKADEPNQGDAQKKPEQAKEGKPDLKKRLPYYLGIALCSVVLVVSGTMLIRYYSQIWRADNATSQLRELYRPQPEESGEQTQTPSPTAVAPTPSNTPTVTEKNATVTPQPTAEQPQATDNGADFLASWPERYPGNEEMRIQERFTPLRQQNRDVVGWLTIEGVVDEPVFQRDNNYYLTHDATGAKNPTGALFLDENCNLRTVPMQTLIHGHNMKEGAMFGSLKKYKVKDASFYREHPFIQFDSLYETATYVIFAVAEVNIVPGNNHYFPFWQQFSFSDYESFRQYVSLAKEYSRFKVDIDVQPGDRLLTLATCSSDDDNLRLIVMARMLRENEDSVMLANQIYSATAK